MTTDIVTRLRAVGRSMDLGASYSVEVVCSEAADEIERLRIEIQTSFDNGYRAAGGTIIPLSALKR